MGNLYVLKKAIYIYIYTSTWGFRLFLFVISKLVLVLSDIFSLIFFLLIYGITKLFKLFHVMCFKFFCFACAICQIMATYLQYLFTFRPQSFLAVWWDNVNFPLLISCFIYLYKNECVCMDIYADFYRVGGTGEWWWVCLNIYTVQETLIYKSNDSWICVCTRGNVYMYFGCLCMPVWTYWMLYFEKRMKLVPYSRPKWFHIHYRQSFF